MDTMNERYFFTYKLTFISKEENIINNTVTLTYEELNETTGDVKIITNIIHN